MRKLIAISLVSAALLTSQTQIALANDSVTAIPSNQSVLVENMVITDIPIYNIDGNNYFKLRDVAYYIDFNLMWNPSDSSITIDSNQSYTDERLTETTTTIQKALPIEQKLTLATTNNSVTLNGYNIAENTYFKIRDLAAFIDFGCYYNESKNAIELSGRYSYHPDNQWGVPKDLSVQTMDNIITPTEVSMDYINNAVILDSVLTNNSLPSTPNLSLGSSQETLEDKYRRIFGDNMYTYEATLPHYPTEAAALADMVDIVIPAWDLNKDGSFYSKNYTITVQKNLADTYSAIFNDIYNLPEKFPIHDIGCYAWRQGTSAHSSGTAIDINANENPQVQNDGSITAGMAYEPGINPYSIEENSAVVNIFAQYGFAWGGNAWQSSKDYMHFTYFGF